MTYNKKLIYVKQVNSGGPSGPRNKGIRLAKGKYIAFFDSDDLMFDRKLEKDIDVLENNPDVSLIFSNYIVLEDSGPRSYSWFEKENVKEIMDLIPKTKINKTVYRFNKPIFDEILLNNFVGTSTVVVRKRDIIDVGFFDESLIGIEDRDMWLRLSKEGKIFAFNSDVFSYYRFLESGISRTEKNLVSKIDFYNRMLKKGLSSKNKRIVNNRLGEFYLDYGFISRNKGFFLFAFLQNIKSLKNINFSNKKKPLIAIGKMIVLIFFPQLKKLKKK